MSEQAKDRRTLLTNQLMDLLDSWGIGAQQKMRLLGLPEDIKPRKMDQFRMNTPFPDTDEVNQHISHIIGIADALRTSYPRNTGMSTVWLQQPHRRLANQTPLTVMLEQGLEGLIRVRSQLDCSFSWGNPV